MQFHARSFIVLSFLSILSACGGGSESSSPSPAPKPTPPPAPTVYELQADVVKGPVENANVSVFRIDLAAPDLMGAEIISGNTDKAGRTFNISLQEPLDDYYLIIADMDDSALDLHTQETPVLTKMLGIISKAELEESTSVNVSPLTTLALQIAAPEINDGETLQTALHRAQVDLLNAFDLGQSSAIDIYRSELLFDADENQWESILQHRVINEVVAALTTYLVLDEQSPDDVLALISEDLKDGLLDGLNVDGLPVAENENFYDDIIGAPIPHLAIAGTNQSNDADQLVPFTIKDIAELLNLENQLLNRGLDLTPLVDGVISFTPGTLSLDTDSDGYPDSTDPDDDNDGVEDDLDAFPLDASESTDTDGDGVGNNADNDDDNDGYLDADDAFPLDATEWVDTDGDGIGNNADEDDDNDGVNDEQDAFPLDSSESMDSDGDGVGDNADYFPTDAACSLAGQGVDGECYLSLIREHQYHSTLSLAGQQVAIVTTNTATGLYNIHIFNGETAEIISIHNDLEATAVGYWQNQDKLLIGRGNQVLELLEDGSTTVFAQVTDSVRKFIDVGDFLVVAENSTQHNVVNSQGVLTDSEDFWYGRSSHYAWDERNDRLFYFSSGISPADYYAIEIDQATGVFGNRTESPYHGDFSIRGPIVISTFHDQVMLGSGDIYNSVSLQWEGSLGTAFSAAFWLSQSELVFVPQQQSENADRFSLLRLNSENGIVESVDTSMAFTALLPQQQGAILISSNADYYQIKPYTPNNDSDADGVDNILDAFPLDIAASVDTDGDGYPDVWNEGYGQADSTTGLTLDAYPNDSACWLNEHGVNNVCDYSATMPIFTPYQTVTDNNNTIYLYNRSDSKVYRWNSEQGYLNPIRVGQQNALSRTSPIKMAFSQQHQRLYFAYASGQITYIALASLTDEVNFAATSRIPSGLVAVGDYVMAVDSSGAWNTHFVFDANGELKDREEWNRSSQTFAWNETLSRVYFLRDGTSPNDLHYEVIDQSSGEITVQDDSPYHSSTGIRHPIKITDDDSIVALGSGYLFDAETLEHVEPFLPIGFTDMYSYQGAYVLLDSQRGDITLVDSANNMRQETLAVISGTAHAFVPFGDDVYVMAIGEDGFEFTFIGIADSDADGLPGWWEQLYGFSDSDAADAGLDSDSDELSNLLEFQNRTNPMLADTDGDGVIDGQEVNVWFSDPLNSDTDGDGLTDGQEVNDFGTDPTSTDSDADGLSDYLEVIELGSNPLSGDSDNDGLPDEWEYLNGLNIIEDDSTVDTDSDGLNNAQEYTYGTQPINPDTDSDGLNDGREVNEFNTDPLFEDSDGDRMFDGFEVNYGLAPRDPTDAAIDSDLDGYANFEEFFLTSDPTDSTNKPTVPHWDRENANAGQTSFLPVYTSEEVPTLRWSQRTDSSLYREQVTSDDAQFYLLNLKTNDSGQLWTLDMVTGERKWNVSTSEGGSSRYGAALVTDSRVYVQASSRLFAFNKPDGQLIFVDDSPHYNALANLTMYNHEPILATNTGLSRLDANARERWAFQVPRVQNIRSIIVQNDSVIFAADMLHRLNAQSGMSLGDPIELSDRDHSASALATGSFGGVIAKTSEDKLMRFKDNETSADWQNEINNDFELDVVVAYGRIYQRNRSSVVVYDELTGDLLGTWLVPQNNSQIRERLVVSRNLFFVATDRETFAVRLSDLTTAWTVPQTGVLSLSKHGALIINARNELFVYNVGPDSDSDGMPDWWEDRYGLDQNIDDSATDSDADGLTALEEYAAKTDPNNGDSDGDDLTDGYEVKTSSTSPLKVDSDNDGLPDGQEVNDYMTNPLSIDSDGDGLSDTFEVLNGFDPLNSGDASADDDADGYSTLDEFFNETDPNDANSKPLLAAWTEGRATAKSNNFINTLVTNVSTQAAWQIETSNTLEPRIINDEIHLISNIYRSSKWQKLESLSGRVIDEKEFSKNIYDVALSQNRALFASRVFGEELTIDSYALDNMEMVTSISTGERSSPSLDFSIHREKLYISRNNSTDTIRVLDLGSGVMNTHSLEYRLSATKPLFNGGVMWICTGATLAGYALDNIGSGAVSEYDWSTQCSPSAQVGSYNNLLVHNGDSITSISTQTGEVMWQFDNAHSDFASGYGKTFAVRNGVLYAIDELTGDILWAFQPDQASVRGDIIVTPNKVIVGGTTRTYIVDQGDLSYQVIEASGDLLVGGSVLLINDQNTLSAYPFYSDQDADGMSDSWEMRYGFDPQNAADASEDADNDGLSNHEEFENGTDPTSSDTDLDGLSDAAEINVHFTSPIDVDTDGDRLSDGDEVNVHLTSPIDEDSDGDGWTDGQEVLQYMTDPNDANSTPTAISSLFESFEAEEIPSSFVETENSSAAWLLTDQEQTDGDQSIRSGVISNDQVSEFVYENVFVAGTLTFDAKLDSESCCDRLEVYLNDTRVVYTTTQEWASYSIDIPSGQNVILFSYRKDGSVSRGQDAVWVDNFEFSQ